MKILEKNIKLKIRQLEMQDASFMLEWMQDKDVVQYLKSDFSRKTLADCEKFINDSYEDENNIHYAITNDENEYMGTVSLKNINKDTQTAEFAIVIRKCAMGNNLSSYAMKWILEFGLNEKGLELIYWCVDLNNKRACRFYEKNGYQKIEVSAILPSIKQIYTKEEIKDYIWYCYSLNRH